MRRFNPILLATVCALSSLAGCSESPMKIGKFTQTTLENGEASHITVQHVLIAFEGSVPGKPIARTKEDAEKLANKVFEQAKAGEDFRFLVQKYSDDDPLLGVYHMANFKQKSDMNNRIADRRVYPRTGMVGAFGNVGFPLKVGEVGLANFDPAESKFGWHIIKRIQ